MDNDEDTAMPCLRDMWFSDTTATEQEVLATVDKLVEEYSAFPPVIQSDPSHSGGLPAEAGLGSSSSSSAGPVVARVVNLLATELDKYGPSAEPEMSPRLSNLVSQMASTLSELDRQRADRLLSTLNMFSVVHVRQWDDSQDLVTELENFCAKQSIFLPTDLVSFFSRLWPKCVLEMRKPTISAVQVVPQLPSPPSHSGGAMEAVGEFPENDVYGKLQPFSPRLQLVVSNQKLRPPDSNVVCRVLSASDFTSVVSANLWDSGLDLQQEVDDRCNAIGLRLSNQVRAALVSIWNAAEQACLRQVRARVDEVVVQQTVSSKSRPPLPSPSSVIPTLPKAPAFNPRYRHSAQPPGEIKYEQGQDKVKQYLEGIEQDRLQVLEKTWLLCFTMGKFSTVVTEYQSVSNELQPKLRNLFYYELKEYPTKTLKTRLSGVKRWMLWAQEAAFQPWNPEVWQVKLYLMDLAESGTSVPKAQLANLKWAQSLLRVKLVDDWNDVQQIVAATSAGTMLQQAIPISISTWVTLEVEAQSAFPLRAALAAVWILLIATSLRFVHLQRSRILAVTDKYLLGLCTLGKSKKRPFRWICPRLSVHGKVDFIQVLLSTFKWEVSDATVADPAKPQWLLPDFGPFRSNLAGASSIRAKPMSLARFHRLSDQLLQDSGEHLTSYRARRLLPTIADLLNYSSADRARVGGWLTSETQQAMKDMSMPNRYSHHATEAEAAIRTRLIIQVRRSLFGLNRKILESMEWPTLLQRAPTSAEASELVSRWRGPGRIFPEGQSEVSSVPPRFLLEDSASDSDSSSSSSSVTSSGSEGDMPVTVGVGLPRDDKVPDRFVVELLRQPREQWGTDAEQITPEQFQVIRSSIAQFGVVEVENPLYVVLNFQKNQDFIDFQSMFPDQEYWHCRFHCTAFENLIQALKIGKSRLAAGWSETKHKCGVYVSDSISGAAFYGHSGASGLCCFVAIITPNPGFNVGKTGTALKTNRCLLRPDQAVIGGAFILPCKRKFQTEIRNPGDLFPAGLTDDNHKNCKHWEPWYSAYVKRVRGLDEHWKFVRLPARLSSI